MNKSEISRSYALLFLVIAIISAVIMFITVFIPAFEMSLFGNSLTNESGFDYIIDIFESSNSNHIKDTSSGSGMIIEEQFDKFIMRGIVIILAFYPIIIAFGLPTFISKKRKDMVVKSIKNTALTCFIWILIYYLFCMYIILKGYDWEFDELFSSEAMIGTKTYLPLIFQLVILVVSVCIKNHWKKAIDGKVEPLSIGTPIQNSHMEQVRAHETIERKKSSTVQNEMDNIDLLQKYKKMLDDQIITQEQFDKKKQELLNIDNFQENNEKNSGEKYRVIFVDYDKDKKLDAIKITRETTGWGLKEAKYAVENLPKCIISGITYEEAVLIKQEYEDVGVTAEIELV